MSTQAASKIEGLEPVQRGDLTHKLVHFTKSSGDLGGWDILRKILDDKKLIAGKPDREGAARYLCFSEAPLAHIGRLLGAGHHTSVKYEPYGIMVNKAWLYALGGRPVIDQHPDQCDLLPDELRYLHKGYDPVTNPPLDYTIGNESGGSR